MACVGEFSPRDGALHIFRSSLSHFFTPCLFIHLAVSAPVGLGADLGPWQMYISIVVWGKKSELESFGWCGNKKRNGKGKCVAFCLVIFTIISSFLSLVFAAAMSAIRGSGGVPATSSLLHRQSPLIKKGWALAKASRYY